MASRTWHGAVKLWSRKAARHWMLIHPSTMLSQLPRKRYADFLASLRQLDSSLSKRREIHLILDNGTHMHPRVEEWFAGHRRYHWHFVPTSASWLNLRRALV